jgi:hypothetical protein
MEKMNKSTNFIQSLNKQLHFKPKYITLKRFRIAVIALHGMTLVNWWLSDSLFGASCIEATLR